MQTTKMRNDLPLCCRFAARFWSRDYALTRIGSYGKYDLRRVYWMGTRPFARVVGDYFPIEDFSNVHPITPRIMLWVRQHNRQTDDTNPD